MGTNRVGRPAGEVVVRNSRHYTDEFFTHGEQAILASAQEIVPMLCGLFAPKSVIDVGCGTGLWLSEFRRRGADVFGLDGDYVNRELLRIPSGEFLACDLTRIFSVDRHFDLVLCLEVAEHLPPASAGDFVRSLCELGPIVVFSAAVPGQGGIQHLNEQWPAYWVDLFEKCGYEWRDLVRPLIWMNERVLWHYRQNTFVFIKKELSRDFPPQASFAGIGGSPLPLVHPAMYHGLRVNSDPEHVSMVAAVRFFARATVSAIRRKIHL